MLSKLYRFCTEYSSAAVPVSDTISKSVFFFFFSFFSRWVHSSLCRMGGSVFLQLPNFVLAEVEAVWRRTDGATGPTGCCREPPGVPCCSPSPACASLEPCFGPTSRRMSVKGNSSQTYGQKHDDKRFKP